MKPSSKLADRTFGAAVVGSIFFVAGLAVQSVPLAVLGLVVALVAWPTWAIIRTMENRS
jgi:hypothetical protein